MLALPAVLATAALVAAAWLPWPVREPAAPAPVPLIERQARRFVSLALSLGAIAPAEVDAYWGPADIRRVSTPSLPQLRADLADLATELREQRGSPRAARLAARTDRLLALVNIMGPVPPLAFEVEAAQVYGLAPPKLDNAGFTAARMALSRLLPGPGPLADRVEVYRRGFTIPVERRPALFARVLAECRRIARAHWPLPVDDRLAVRWNDDVPAAWHQYRGRGQATLDINPNAVADAGKMVDVACHEAYPGHQAQFLLAEAEARPRGLPIEDRVALLRSPASVLREGAADYGVELALPPAARLAFDRDVLFPAAGLPTDDLDRFEAVQRHVASLSAAALPILQGYRDGALDAAAAAQALRRDALVESPAALLDYVDRFGAYAAGYTSVRGQVRAFVERAGPDRWATLACLLRSGDGLAEGEAACTGR